MDSLPYPLLPSISFTIFPLAKSQCRIFLSMPLAIKERPSDTNLTDEDVRTFLEPILARYEIPRYFRFVDTPLPRGATGKIFKRQLRDEARAALAPQ